MLPRNAFTLVCRSLWRTRLYVCDRYGQIEMPLLSVLPLTLAVLHGVFERAQRRPRSLGYWLTIDRPCRLAVGTVTAASACPFAMTSHS